MKYSFLIIAWALLIGQIFAQTPKPPYTSSKFEQLGTELPTPNSYRTASGAPGENYWQQKADYKIQVELNDDNQTIKGNETITYYNYSPHELTYLWLQLDQNHFDKDSDTPKTMSFDLKSGNISYYSLLMWVRSSISEGGYQILSVKDATGKPLKYTINKTMMRVDLPTPLKPKTGVVSFSVEWQFKIVDATKTSARSGYEFFKEDGNYVYEIAQWFPRMCVYSDVYGWQNKQFLGRGEFALTFGDYEVSITVPADHIVAATGELQNPQAVLTPTQIQRLNQARNTFDKPVIIHTQDEALQAEKNKATTKKTWIYKAKNVRDFAFATSRKFIWDAMTAEVNGRKILCMSYYPKEGNPLWEEISTKVVAHTIKTYSKYTIDYPYPVAISVHGPVGGMEYPMISFNNQGRPDKEGKYTEEIKNNTISVIIHEVGHNFFPMIINSDERQWSWMDEGLNTFCQYLAEQEWEKGFPSWRGPAAKIVPYMKSDKTKLVPIMTNSEQIASNQFGNNAYGKPATALNILRETIMGRELFDYAFKEYARRWAFKHPEPADFFRTMEDASAVDLDWFWRGWFFGTEPCDIAIENVELYRVPSKEKSKETNTLNIEEKELNTAAFAMLRRFIGELSEKEAAVFAPENYFYLVEFRNVGGLIMPIILRLDFKDGTSETHRIPAEIWRIDPEKVNKVFLTKKEVAAFVLDPQEETADIDTSNNFFPKKSIKTKFEEFKQNNSSK
ncbi:MAG: M1 family metallopeptidase [Microscillaceae bacterium]|nr:M1 family metallopeptidase [Microscillaceae bacterium]MDW8461069.1 M1 family metallopeptidase [Cytophagales bacterium]